MSSFFRIKREENKELSETGKGRIDVWTPQKLQGGEGGT